MRKYIRHPSDIPIEVELQNHCHQQKQDRLTSISVGGLSFYSKASIQISTPILIKIPFVTPPFEAHCRVVWCRSCEFGFELGVELLDQDDVYRARMIEQVCHIEHYKREMLEQEGRALTSAQAALEWIAKYARDFPAISTVEV